MNYPFREAILRDSDGDLSKRWYVEFYVWDVAQSKLIRKRDYDINKAKTREGRIAKANTIIEEINKALRQGYLHDSDNANEEVSTSPKLQPVYNRELNFFPFHPAFGIQLNYEAGYNCIRATTAECAH